MSSTSPPPNSSVSSSSSNSTPPQPSSLPNPQNPLLPPPPSALPTTGGPPPPSLQPAASVIQSPALPSTPSMSSPPPKSSPPPEPTASPPPPANLPPPSLNPPPQPSSPPPASHPPPSDPPANSPPPPSPTNPRNSPPPPSTNQPPPPSLTPETSPPPPSNAPPPPPTKPPSPPTQPPHSSPPPPLPKPPDSSPPPPQPKPPDSSPPPPPPPQPKPPESSPLPPTSSPPQNSPPPPPSTPGTTPVSPRPQPSSPPSSNPSPLSPPPPAIQTSPPSPLPPNPPSPSIVSPASPSTNSSSDSAPRNSQSSGGGDLHILAIIGIFSAVALFFLVLGYVAWRAKKRKKVSGRNGGYIMPTFSGSSQEADSASLKLQMSAPNNGSGSGSGVVYSPHEHAGFGNSRSWFTYQELVEATDGFSDQNLLGEGGFGYVYKGILADGRVVAVKQLRIGGGQGEREFRSEVEIISRIHHRHLVSLVGYCINENRRLLVYDYVSNNNLYFHLHGEDSRTVLDWGMRAKIALGAARGIAYLHEDCHPRIIHRDIKSSNILLDNNFEARVSDFGLAKLAGDANTHITTRVMGTFGYLAPEYASTGKLTERSDVYSFGVVLLELITGRKPVDASQDESLVEWARPLLSRALETHEFGELADPMLNSEYVDSEMFLMIEAAAACVRHSSLKRPKMGQVVRALDTMASSDLTNGMRVGESAMFNPAQQSQEIQLLQRIAFGNQSFSTGFFRQDSWDSEGDRVNSRIE
ncbi:hypothetical protein ACS0TY_008251 [Phlomoides rotata]